MPKRLAPVFLFAISLLLLASCNELAVDTPAEPEAQPEGTFLWNGFGLTREDFLGSSELVFLPENVLSQDERTLRVYFMSGLGNDSLEYGVNEVIQINLDDAWYSLPRLLSEKEQPLILPPLPHDVEYLSEQSRIEYTIDLSVFNTLPSGRYRLVERFFWERLQTEMYYFAYFWIVEPGENRPPESESSGPARLEDIVFFVESPYEARRVITAADSMLSMSIENRSGKQYIARNAILEMKQGNQWINVGYQHANLGSMLGWNKQANILFLNDPLTVGDYRLRLTMGVMGNQSFVEPEYEFSVIAYERAPEPAWDVLRLALSSYNSAEHSAGVTMTIVDPILNKDKMELEIVLAAENDYSYGDAFSIDVLLDGEWYSVPFVQYAFNSLGYSIGANTALANRSYIRNPVFVTGILPAGQYRLLKAFDLISPDTTKWGGPVYLAKEIVCAEFMVEETLEWLDY